MVGGMIYFHHHQFTMIVYNLLAYENISKYSNTKCIIFMQMKELLYILLLYFTAKIWSRRENLHSPSPWCCKFAQAVLPSSTRTTAYQSLSWQFYQSTQTRRRGRSCDHYFVHLFDVTFGPPPIITVLHEICCRSCFSFVPEWNEYI